MHRWLKNLLYLLVLIPCISITYAPRYNDVYQVFGKEKEALDILSTMSVDEKIGQLFMIPVYTDRSDFHKKEILHLIEEQHLGGVIFMKGHPYKQYKWTKEFEAKAPLPMLIAMDAEWGPNMRLDSTVKHPKQMTLGAIKDQSLIRKLAGITASELSALGVNVSFGPVVDVNSNPENPVIHMRSFGEDKKEVADRAIQYMNGLQENGIISVAKHFPGHGDTYIDSHLDLPEIQHSKRRIAKLELYPFSRVFEMGIAATMTAHIRIPELQKHEQIPGSLSPRIVSKMLRKDLDFEGLVFSDALNMQAVTKYVDEDEIDISAYLAGNDILLFPRNMELAREQIKAAIANKEATEEDLNNRVLRILMAKLWAKEKRTVSDSMLTREDLNKSLNSGSVKSINQELSENAITTLNIQKKAPSGSLSDTVLLITIGSFEKTVFEKSLELYSPVKTIRLPHNLSKNPMSIPEIKEKARFQRIIIALFNVNPYKVQNNFGYGAYAFKTVEELCNTLPEAVLVNFGTPYLLGKLEIDNGIVQAYEELPSLQEAAAEVLFHAIGAKGRLPVGAGKYHFGSGQETYATNVLRYGLPEQEGLSSEQFAQIDSIALKAIKDEATPGCQVLVGLNGRIVYQKAFGNHKYEDGKTVEQSDLYDIASITKVMASTMMAMRLYEMGTLGLDKTLDEYLGKQVDSSKKTLAIREILTHQSGLSAWIPFYKYTLTDEGLCDSNYCYAPNEFYTTPVADSLYTHSGIRDTIYKLINGSRMKTRGEYLYSDLGYFYMLKIFDTLGYPMPDAYLESNFYGPMGMSRTLYNPLKRFEKQVIVPTEVDKYFRQQLVHGYVHDPAAAMLGGVAGHAGLFSNVNDMAKLFQMLLNDGSYNNTNYFEKSTVALFTSKQYENNRKGLGFDKPEKRPNKPGPTIRDVSPATFGHTGFTGTCVWADPEYDLVYIFLSNRIHPTAENMKLIRNNVRTDILQVVYDDLLDKEAAD